MDNQKREYNRMKHNLEKWRELILVLHSVLKWEQNFYPGVICGVVAFVFLVLWYMDLTFVTCTALIGLVCTLFDYFYPKFAKMIFKPEKWRGPEEKKFEEIAEELFRVKVRFTSLWQFIVNAKNEKSTLFILAASTVCVILAWIGSTINNQLLAFLTVLCLLLYPGLAHKGYFDVINKVIASRFNSQAGDVKKEN